MTLQEKIIFILLTYPETKFHRTEFFVHYLAEFHQMELISGENVEEGFFYMIEPIQLRAFFSDFATVERTLRKILKEDKRFKLPPEADMKRALKAKEFAIQYAKGRVFNKI